MRALQILFLISFAVLALIVPIFVFSSVQGESNSTILIVLIALIFAANGFFVIRKLIGLRKNKS